MLWWEKSGLHGVLVFIQLMTGHYPPFELPPKDKFTQIHSPAPDYTYLSLVISDSPPPMTASVCGETQVYDRNKMRDWMFDIFKQPLTHISPIPKGCVEWLLVMLEQVLDVSKAFNLEDLWFFLNDFPEKENPIIEIQHAYYQHAPVDIILARCMLSFK